MGLIISILFLSGCIHDTDITVKKYLNGDVIVRYGKTYHVAKQDFIEIEFKKNCSYMIEFSYNVGGTFGIGSRITERFDVDVPFVPYTYMIQRNIILYPEFDIKQIN